MEQMNQVISVEPIQTSHLCPKCNTRECTVDHTVHWFFRKTACHVQPRPWNNKAVNTPYQEDQASNFYINIEQLHTKAKMFDFVPGLKFESFPKVTRVFTVPGIKRNCTGGSANTKRVGTGRIGINTNGDQMGQQQLSCFSVRATKYSFWSLKECYKGNVN